MASPNITIGPMIQFWTRESSSIFQLRKTCEKLFVPDLGERWVHHQIQADGDQHIGCPDRDGFVE